MKPVAEKITQPTKLLTSETVSFGRHSGYFGNLEITELETTGAIATPTASSSEDASSVTPAPLLSRRISSVLEETRRLLDPYLPGSSTAEELLPTQPQQIEETGDEDWQTFSYPEECSLMMPEELMSYLSDFFHMPSEETAELCTNWSDGVDFSELPFDNLDDLLTYCETKLTLEERARLFLVEDTEIRQAFESEMIKNAVYGGDSDRRVYLVYLLKNVSHVNTFSGAADVLNKKVEFLSKKYPNEGECKKINAQGVQELLFTSEPSPKELCSLSLTFGSYFNKALRLRCDLETRDGRDAIYWYIKRTYNKRGLKMLPSVLNSSKVSMGKKVPCPFGEKWKQEHAMLILFSNLDDAKIDSLFNMLHDQGKKPMALKQLYYLANQGNLKVLKRLASIASDQGVRIADIAAHFVSWVDIPAPVGGRAWKAHMVYQLINDQEITTERPRSYTQIISTLGHAKRAREKQKPRIDITVRSHKRTASVRDSNSKEETTKLGVSSQSPRQPNLHLLGTKKMRLQLVRLPESTIQALGSHKRSRKV